MASAVRLSSVCNVRMCLTVVLRRESRDSPITQANVTRKLSTRMVNLFTYFICNRVSYFPFPSFPTGFRFPFFPFPFGPFPLCPDPDVMMPQQYSPGGSTVMPPGECQQSNNGEVCRALFCLLLCCYGQNTPVNNLETAQCCSVVQTRKIHEF